MPLHASASLPQIQLIPPRIPPAAEVEQYRIEARFRNVMNVADRTHRCHSSYPPERPVCRVASSGGRVLAHALDHVA